VSTSPPLTPDRRYIVVRGRLWRATNPHLSAQERATWVARLMDARRAVQAAMRGGDAQALRTARCAVDAASTGWASAGRSGGRTAARITTGT